MLRKLISHIVLFFVAGTMFGQMDFYNGGSSIVVKENSSLHINGDFIHQEDNGVQPEVASAGEIYLNGDFQNNSENNVFVTNAGKVIFFGDSIQEILGDSSVHFYSLEISKGANEVILNHTIYVSDTMLMDGGNVFLNDNNIELGTSGVLAGETNDTRIYGTEGLVRATRSLTGDVENIAGLGLSIESSVSLGTSLIERGHDSQVGSGTGSILRYYNLEASNLGDVLDNIQISYLDTNEFNGKEEAKFSLWQSDNGGVVWNPLETNPSGTDELQADNISINSNSILFTVAESTCTDVPAVDLGADTIYLCETDTTTLDAQNPGLYFFWNTGENTQTIDVNIAGEYNVAVRDANGCVGYDTLLIIAKPYPVLAFDADRVCQDATTVFENNSTINADTMSFSWDFGITTSDVDTSTLSAPTFVYDTSGAYTVTLTAISDYSCTTIQTETYIVHPNPVADFDVESLCLSEENDFTNNSSIQASIGTLAYSISANNWEFGDPSGSTSIDENPTFTYPSEGAYTAQLIVESNAGCRDTISKSLEIYPRATVDFTYNAVCEGSDISLVNNSTVGSGSNSYSWDFGDGLFSTLESPSKTYVTNGDYNIKLVATTDNGCADSLTQTVTIYDVPVADFTLNDTCATKDLSIVNNSSITTSDALTYGWDFGDGNLSTDEVPMHSYGTDGDYTVWLKVTSANSCVDSISQVSTINPMPIADFQADNVCEGGDVIFQNFSQVSSGGVSYSWDFGTGNSSTFKNPIETYTTDGVFTVQLIATSSLGCVDTTENDVTIYSEPFIDLDDASTCSDQYFLDAQNVGSTYIWSDGSTDQTFTVISSGNYSVNVTNANNCSAYKQVAISLNSTFSPSLGDDLVACDDTLIDAGNAGSQAYSWSTGETERSISVYSSGEYSVEVTDQNGCLGYDTINVTINASPVLDLGDDLEFCEGETRTVASGVTASSYNWSHGEITSTISVTQSGDYELIVTTSDNCSATDQISVLVNSLPAVSLGDDQTVCDSVTLDAGNIGSSYLWSDGSVSQTLLASVADEYVVEVTDINGCQNSDTIEVAIAPKPVVNLGDDQTLCSGNQVTLDAGTDGDTYDWSDGTSTHTYVVGSTGQYFVTVSNSYGCSQSDTVNITIEELVLIDLGDDQTVCLGQELTLDAGISNVTYEWGSTAGFTGDEQQVSVGDSATYWVIVTSDAGCSGLDSITVTVSKDTIHSDFLSVSNITEGDTVQFIAVMEYENVDYAWDFGTGVTSTLEDPLHTFLSAGTYDVSFTVYNAFCSATVVKPIEVEEKKLDEEESVYQSLFSGIIDLKAYPNPSSDAFVFYLEAESELAINLKLVDMTGVVLDERTIEGDVVEETYDISLLAQSVYILKISSSTEERYIRVVKQ